jgi:hypothetical protein
VLDFAINNAITRSLIRAEEPHEDNKIDSKDDLIDACNSFNVAKVMIILMRGQSPDVIVGEEPLFVFLVRKLDVLEPSKLREDLNEFEEKEEQELLEHETVQVKLTNEKSSIHV